VIALLVDNSRPWISRQTQWIGLTEARCEAGDALTDVAVRSVGTSSMRIAKGIPLQHGRRTILADPHIRRPGPGRTRGRLGASLNQDGAGWRIGRNRHRAQFGIRLYSRSIGGLRDHDDVDGPKPRGER
jgi:hypothetical protein